MSGSAAVASRIRQYFDQRLAAVVAAAARLRAGDGDDDPEAIHDLRVAARRLSEALAVWHPLLEPAAAERARRTVRRLRRRLGAPRESEVNLEQLDALVPGLELAARLVAEPLVERLRRRVLAGRRRARRAARLGRIDRLVGRVAQAGAGLEAKAVAGPDPLPAARALAERRRTEAREALAAAAGHDDDDALLHQARIAIKKDRYAEEILSAVDAPPSPSPSGGASHSPTAPSPRGDALRRLQQTLGTVHDRAMLLAWVEERARRWRDDDRHERAQALAPLLERLAAERRAALQQLPRRLEALSGPPSAPPGGHEPSAPTGGPAGDSAPAPPTPPGSRSRAPAPGS